MHLGEGVGYWREECRVGVNVSNACEGADGLGLVLMLGLGMK